MRIYLIFIIVVSFVGCSSLSPHQKFIRKMGEYIMIPNKYDIQKTDDTKLDDKYLQYTTYDDYGDTIYHFKCNDKKCPCKYYIVVNKKGNIIGWGFDKCDYKKCCLEDK